jgi:hypothetical protein
MLLQQQSRNYLSAFCRRSTELITALFGCLQADVIMDSLGHRENGSQGPGPYKSILRFVKFVI